MYGSRMRVFRGGVREKPRAREEARGDRTCKTVI